MTAVAVTRSRRNTKHVSCVIKVIKVHMANLLQTMIIITIIASDQHQICNVALIKLQQLLLLQILLVKVQLTLIN